MAPPVTGLGPEPEGATPLADEEIDGLIPDHVTTRAELNLAEFENLVRALPWARRQADQRSPDDLLTWAFLVGLHRRMFGDVWRWAGTLRVREANIGVDPAQITEQVRLALDDAQYWRQHATFPADEIAVRLHHRLVSIHPFPNGNGRCTRLLADLYLMAAGEPWLTWGGSVDLGETGAMRVAYLDALRAADRGDCQLLVEFARSGA